MKTALWSGLVLAAGWGAWAGPAAGQADKPKLPPQVHHALVSLVKDCRDMGGKPGKSPALLTIADLTGDRFADFVIYEGAFDCEGAESAYSGTGGSQLAIYADNGKGQAAKVFEHGVFDVKVDKTVSPAAIKVVVGGVFCGQQITKNTPRSEMELCWRPLVWNASKKAMEFAPLSRIELVK